MTRRSSIPTSRYHSEPPRRCWVPNTIAANQMPPEEETVAIAPCQERDWRKDISDGLWQAWRAGELNWLWRKEDVEAEIARQIAEEEERRREEDNNV